MEGYDLFMIVVLVGAIAWGAWKGLAWQVASLASMILSYFVALNFRMQIAGFITASPPWNIFLAMLILFLATSLVVWVGFNLVSEAIEKVKLKEFDRQLGAMFGFAKGVLLCVLITLFAVTLLSEPQRQAICNSKSGYYIAVLLDKADPIMPGEVHEVLDPYIDRLDQQVSQQPAAPASPWQLPPNLLGGGTAPEEQPFSLPTFTPGEAIRARPAGSFDPNSTQQPQTARPASGDLRRW